MFHLPDRLQEVIVAAYGLDGAPPRSLAAPGRRYGVSRESVHLWRNEAKALRTIQIRHHSTDEDLLTCLKRGYDEHGVPLCPHGYCLAFNGHDYRRGDSKWACRQRCTCHPTPDVAPDSLTDEKRAAPSSCPYRHPEHPLGYTVTINLTLPDDSLRLARGRPPSPPNTPPPPAPDQGGHDQRPSCPPDVSQLYRTSVLTVATAPMA